MQPLQAIARCTVHKHCTIILRCHHWKAELVQTLHRIVHVAGCEVESCRGT